MKGGIEKKNQFNKMTKKQSKEYEPNFLKITYHKLRLNDQIENKSKFYKRIQEQKFKIKIIRIELNISKSNDNSEILHGQTRFSRRRETKVEE